MKMEQIADAIEDAIKKECFLPALALSLVIPDICAEFEYPDIYNKKVDYNGHKGQGAAYSKWYDEKIGNYDIDPDTGIGIIDGFSCWRLRCEFLHSAYIDLNDFMSRDGKTIKFTFTSSKMSNLKCTIGGGSIIHYSQDKKERTIKLDIADFCGKILAVLRTSYLTNQDFVKKTDNKRLYFDRNF